MDVDAKIRYVAEADIKAKTFVFSFKSMSVIKIPRSMKTQI